MGSLRKFLHVRIAYVLLFVYLCQKFGEQQTN